MALTNFYLKYFLSLKSKEKKEEREEEVEAFECEVSGYISNANYSSAKGVFILFINNRLVDCHNLKKSIDDVYSPILPKVFIYRCHNSANNTSIILP